MTKDTKYDVSRYNRIRTKHADHKPYWSTITQALTSHVEAMHNCRRIHHHFEDYHEEAATILADLIAGRIHSVGVHFDIEASTEEKLVFRGSWMLYHPEHQTFERYIDYTVTVKGSLLWGIDFTIKGRFGSENQDIKAMLEDQWHEALNYRVYRPDVHKMAYELTGMGVPDKVTELTNEEEV